MIPLKKPEIGRNEDELLEDDDNSRPDLIHFILLNRTMRIIFAIAVSAIIMPVTFYMLYFSREITNGIQHEEFGSCSHPELYHVPCGYENITASECMRRGCCYTSYSNCYHSLPARYQYEALDRDITMHPLRNQTPFNNTIPPLQQLQLSIYELTESRVRIQLRDPSNSDGDNNSSDTIHLNHLANNYTYEIFKPMVFVEIKRIGSNQTLFSTSRGPLIATGNYLEWSVYLGGDLYFGLGEAILEAGSTKVVLNTGYDAAIPFIMAYDIHTDSYHGIVFTAPGPVEVQFLKSKLFIFRAIFSGNFEFELLLGPTPASVHDQLKQYTQNHYSPPYWSYGIHYCKMDTLYNETDAVLTLKNNLQNTNNIFDSHCYHDNLFWFTSTTLSDYAQNALDSITAKNKKKLLSFTPHLEVQDLASYYAAANILIRKANGMTLYSGRISNKRVTYIDWLNIRGETESWISNNLGLLKTQSADGYTLQNNWLRDDTANLTQNIHYQNLTFVPSSVTLQMSNMSLWNATLTDANSTRIIFKYNQLEENQLTILKRHLNGKDKFIVTSSYGIFTAAGVLVKNVTASWSELGRQVRKAIGLSIAGLSFSGVPACGDIVADKNLSEELCIRWYQFSSLLPLFRISTDRIPSKFSSFTQRIMNNIIKRRYSLTDYFYHIISSGESFIRPMFYHFPSIRNYSAELMDQFLIGRCILAAPVLLPKANMISIYVPDGFFELWGGRRMPADIIVDYAVVETDLPLFIRSGCIVPLHETESKSLLATRLEPIYFIIALRCNSHACRALGHLTIDDNLSLQFDADEDEITITPNLEVSALRESICNNRTDITHNIASARIYGHPFSNNTLNIKMDLNLCTTTSFIFNYAIYL